MPVTKNELLSQKKVLLFFLFISVTLLALSQYKVQDLQKEIEYREMDYSILLQICNEKG